MSVVRSVVRSAVRSVVRGVIVGLFWQNSNHQITDGKVDESEITE